VEWAIAGLVTVGAGGYAQLRGATLHAPEKTDPEVVRGWRKRWIAAGAVLVVAGVIVIRKAN
jgi:hypothetical protein